MLCIKLLGKRLLEEFDRKCISVSPHTIPLHAGKQQEFAAAVAGLLNPVLTWTPSGGTITSRGLCIALSDSAVVTGTVPESNAGTECCSNLSFTNSIQYSKRRISAICSSALGHE